ncbi:MAG: hypothetical protein Tsb005_14300 [Gammaproteobacteria bacterium]
MPGYSATIKPSKSAEIGKDNSNFTCGYVVSLGDDEHENNKLTAIIECLKAKRFKKIYIVLDDYELSAIKLSGTNKNLNPNDLTGIGREIGREWTKRNKPIIDSILKPNSYEIITWDKITQLKDYDTWYKKFSRDDCPAELQLAIKQTVKAYVARQITSMLEGKVERSKYDEIKTKLQEYLEKKSSVGDELRDDSSHINSKKLENCDIDSELKKYIEDLEYIIKTSKEYILRELAGLIVASLHWETDYFAYPNSTIEAFRVAQKFYLNGRDGEKDPQLNNENKPLNPSHKPLMQYLQIRVVSVADSSKSKDTNHHTSNNATKCNFFQPHPSNLNKATGISKLINDYSPEIENFLELIDSLNQEGRIHEKSIRPMVSGFMDSYFNLLLHSNKNPLALNKNLDPTQRLNNNSPSPTM